MLEKAFKNVDLGVEITSYIDFKCRIWFKAKEVAQILGYKNTEHAIKRHVSENHKKTFLLSCPPETGGQVQGRWIIFIGEPGFYELVFRSRLPSAKMFREWVFTKVLPSIRKYGYFKMFKSKKQRVIIDGVKFYKHNVFTNYAATKDGDVINLKTKKIMKMRKNNCGYLNFNIYDGKLKKTKIYSNHRFVYEVFKGIIPDYLEVDHLNNIKTDNRIKNLQLLSHEQNVEKSHNKKIICTCIETGEERIFISIKKASIELDIGAGFISNICRKIKHHKSATSKRNGRKYTFKFMD